MKRNVLTKILCVLAAVLVLTAAVLPASAEETGEVKTEKKYGSLLVLGDSISTGYGLPDYDFAHPENPYDCASYGNRLARALHLEAGKTYINKAVNGDRTEDLLALLPSLQTEIAASDLIVISIGGNDLLRKLPDLMSILTGAQITDYAQAMTALSLLQPENMAGAAANPQITQMLTEAVMSNAMNLAQIVATLKANNPTAEVVFLKQYNPAIGVPSMQGMNMLAQPLIAQVNATMDRVVVGAGYKVADVPSVIDSSAAARTNILSMDIHPNLAGHGMIYELLCDTLGIEKECIHAWGEWKEISEGPATEPWTAERVCTKCGETETKEFPAKETAAPETTTAPEDTKEPGKEKKKGCKSAVGAAAAVIALCGAAFVGRKHQ